MKLSLSENLRQNAKELERLAAHFRQAGLGMTALLIGAAAVSLGDEEFRLLVAQKTARLNGRSRRRNTTTPI